METATTVLAVIGAVSLVWWVLRALGAFLAWVERSEIERQTREAAAEAAVAAPSKPAKVRRAAVAEGLPAEHVAAIAATVAAILDGHRVVLIEDTASGAHWSAEGRWLHQTSHRLH